MITAVSIKSVFRPSAVLIAISLKQQQTFQVRRVGSRWRDLSEDALGYRRSEREGDMRYCVRSGVTSGPEIIYRSDPTRIIALDMSIRIYRICARAGDNVLRGII